MADKRPGRRFILFAFGFLLILLAYTMIADGRSPKDVGYTAFMTEAEAGHFTTVTVDEGKRTLAGKKPDGSEVVARYVGTDNIAEQLRAKGADVKVTVSGEGWGSVLIGLLPTLLFIGFLLLIARWLMRANTGSNIASTIGGSKARRIDPHQLTTRFSDVLGADEAVEEAREFVDFLRNPDRFQRLKGRIPKGILFTGPPGCGKTLLARAIAGEAGVPFFHVSGSDFVELFVGVGAARVRSMMEEAKKVGRCIVFIDEIDAVGRHRGSGIGYTNDERETTLNQLLIGMDGFEPGSTTLFIAATNRPDVLDPALIRPGRFDRRVVISLPDVNGRRAILGHYVREMPLGSDVDLDTVAAMTPGFSGADLENLVNEAALLASRAEREEVTPADIESAFDKVTVGGVRKLVIGPEEKRRLAFHEAGHTLVTWYEGGGNAFHKVTIVPHGPALGYSMSLPRQENFLLTESQIRAQIKTALGGRVAEQLAFTECSSGASDDLRKAYSLADAMIRRFGMSANFGPVSYDQDHGPMFLGRDLVERRSYSEATGREIDLEIRGVLRGLEEKVIQLLTEKRTHLQALAAALAERETLNRAEVEEILAAV